MSFLLHSLQVYDNWMINLIVGMQCVQNVQPVQGASSTVLCNVQQVYSHILYLSYS